MATETAAPSHNHPEGIKGAVVTALTIFHLKQGRDKEFIRTEILGKYYPYWKDKAYKDFHDDYTFDSTCPGTVGPAIICFLESKDYADCLRLVFSLGRDASHLVAIAGPMAYAYYREMPEQLIRCTFDMLPDWMIKVNNDFDLRINSK